jgi:uncharacterized protein (DUF3084 family)
VQKRVCQSRRVRGRVRQRPEAWTSSKTPSLALEQRDKEITNRDKRIDKLTEAIAERDRRLKQQQMVIDGQAEKLSTAQHVAGIAAAANTQLAEVFT